MKLNNVQPALGFIDHGEDKKRDERKSKKTRRDSSKKSILVDFNNVLHEKSYPYLIIEKDNAYFYADIHSREILGEVEEEFILNLTTKIRANSSETEKQLTYDKKGPSGDHLDLEI